MKRSPLILLVAWLGMLASSNANALWPLNGGAPCPDTGAQQSPVITSDGAGGAIIAWSDARRGDFDIYASRVAPAGNTLWCGPVCTAAGDQLHPAIVADGAGGAIITWEDG